MPVKKKKAKKKAKSRKPALNPQYAKFIKEYIRTGNGTQAAIFAGYSKKTARSKASQLLTIINIREKINSELDKIFENDRKFIQHEIIKESRKIAAADLLDYDLNNLKKSDISSAISQIKEIISKDGSWTREIKLFPKSPAIDQLMKYLNLYKENEAASTPITYNIIKQQDEY